MAILLNKMGCRFDIVSGGQDAIAKVRTTVYDVIFMDIQMPVMDGFLTARIITKELDVATPIIALTARVFSDDKDKCREAGMVDFLAKPISVSELRKKIETWMKITR
jgi:CheY-like chemotaxis protein